jgi:hypothetical protein
VIENCFGLGNWEDYGIEKGLVFEKFYDGGEVKFVLREMLLKIEEKNSENKFRIKKFRIMKFRKKFRRIISDWTFETENRD